MTMPMLLAQQPDLSDVDWDQLLTQPVTAQPDLSSIDLSTVNLSNIDISNFDFSNINYANNNWHQLIAQSLEAPAVEQLSTDPGIHPSTLGWDQLLVQAAPDLLGAAWAELVSPPKPKARTRVTIREQRERRKKNCHSWIKKDNYVAGGKPTRVHKPRDTSRLFRTLKMPQPMTLAQHQRHTLGLISRILSLRSASSPFTLVLDDLNQSARQLITEMIQRALSRNVNVVFVSFESKRAHPRVRHIAAYGPHTGDQILAEIDRAMNDYKESLVIVDSLYDLLQNKGINMSALFGVVSKHNSLLLGVYHQDIVMTQSPDQAYNPSPLDVVKYMATTIMTCKSLSHVLAAKAARDRSHAEPLFGLNYEAEGIVQALGSNDPRGTVLDVEFRRKSGRAENESFFLRRSTTDDFNEPLPGYAIGTLKRETVVLLDQLPEFQVRENASEAEKHEATFNLELTEQQRAARDAVALPYFDAQNMEDGEQGGRILYDMGVEDDFDEEEDEI